MQDTSQLASSASASLHALDFRDRGKINKGADVQCVQEHDTDGIILDLQSHLDNLTCISVLSSY